MIQMAANPNYQGFLAVNNAWAQAILIKHIVFGLIILVSAYQSFSLLPAIEHAALLAAKGRESPEQTQLDRKTNQLMRLNLALGVAVLLLTAWARVSA
jgi:putative copper export protein